MPFPSPPWLLRGTLWLSLFPVRSGAGHRRSGLYAAAFVDYRHGGVLTYRELLVARLVRDGVLARVHITDIWVDSPASRDGGRALWAIPKDLADLRVRDRRVGPTARTACEASTAGSALAAARFTGVVMPVPRAPLRFSTRQAREDGTPVVAGVSGSAGVTPCLGRWDFDADGPLGWLHGRQPVMSLRMADFRIRFGAPQLRTS